MLVSALAGRVPHKLLAIGSNAESQAAKAFPIHLRPGQVKLPGGRPVPEPSDLGTVGGKVRVGIPVLVSVVLKNLGKRKRFGDFKDGLPSLALKSEAGL
jgi:hypothetical protein